MRHALHLVIGVLVSGRISCVCSVKKRAAARSVMDGLQSVQSLHSSCRRHEQVPGLPGQSNDVIVCGDVATAKKHVIFFGGDVQDYPERMSNHRDNKRYLQWNLENTAQILLKRFQDSAVFVVKPSSMHLNTFSVYSNFVETNDFGSPTHSRFPRAWIHLKPLHCTVVSKELAIHSGSSGKEACDTEVPLILIGFSKGCIVLNQMLYSLLLALGDPKTKDFVNQVEEFYWLDGGHSGGHGNTWISDTESLQNLSQLKTKIHVHVTPYQVHDPMRTWVGKEEKKFVSKLKKFGADITETLHFDDLPPSIENHFGVLKEF
ncbi:mitochondrial protein C2orf69 homolog [Haliotis rufescens]|uniref:mitochondrial protein C2orf69 homolog n=1 Tax=Haliotis rufescens TaxID=6454 RepID=UPI00201F8EA3|nr:mitochondrial protein C2orf69 homolog [Haliotis rufescens]